MVPRETGRDWLPSGSPGRWPRLIRHAPAGWLTSRSGPSTTRRRTCFSRSGSKSRDLAAARQAFQTAMQGIDRLMKDGVEYSNMLTSRQILLPMVEQIDPALVPEYFWRIVATRPSVGNPRSVDATSASALIAASGLVRPRCGRGLV